LNDVLSNIEQKEQANGRNVEGILSFPSTFLLFACSFRSSFVSPRRSP